MDNYNSLLVGGFGENSQLFAGIPILLVLLYAVIQYFVKGNVYNSTTYNRFILTLFALVLVNFLYNGKVWSDYRDMRSKGSEAWQPFWINMITFLIYISIFYLFLTMVYQPPMPKLDIKF